MTMKVITATIERQDGAALWQQILDANHAMPIGIYANDDFAILYGPSNGPGSGIILRRGESITIRIA